MAANQIEYDAAVYVARRLAGRHLKICQVDLTHRTSFHLQPSPSALISGRCLLFGARTISEKERKRQKTVFSFQWEEKEMAKKGDELKTIFFCFLFLKLKLKTEN
jgi:hypothetical protein